MRPIPGFKSVKTKTTFWMFVIALLPLMLVSAIIYFHDVTSIKEEVFSKLTAIRDLKVREIDSWTNERIGDIKTIADDPSIRAIETITTASAAGRNPSTEHRILAEILEHFSHYLRNYTAYNEIFILDPQTGKVLISTDKSHQGADESDNPYYLKTLKKNGVYIREIYYSEAINSLAMSIAIPIRPVSGTDDTSRISGILVGRINISHSLFALLEDRTGMGGTGETLIVNKDRLDLTPLRWHPGAPLKFTIRAKPATLAADGQTGIIEALDYRKVPVLAAYTWIPRLEWGFVAKVDQKEAYAPITRMLQYILLVLVFSAVIIFILAMFLSRRLTRPITDLAAVAEKIAGGDLSARSAITDGDELGLLGESFNLMADTIASKMTVQKSRWAINAVMLRARTIDQLAMALIRELVQSTTSCFGAFYLRNTDTNRFEPIYTMGLNRKALRAFDAENPEGEIGYAITEKKISHIRNIPPDTVFTFKMISGTAVPSEIITIPIFIQKKATALISLGTLSTYAPETMEMLEQVYGAIGIALSNLINAEATRDLAQQLKGKNQDLSAQAGKLEEQATELEAQTRELEAQNMELDLQKQQIETANRLKSEFLSNMSHELRTPLNSVLALSRVLIMQSGGRLSDEEQNYLTIIERNGKQLLKLINDILDLSKIEAGRFEVNPEPISLASIVANICERIGPLAREKHIEILQQIPDDLPRPVSDEGRVSRILENLIGNGVKFTDTGTVTISAKADKEMVSIDITDTGIGIPAADLPYIFDEFRQVDGTASRRHEGTGLGLAIACKTAKTLGGSIDVASIPSQGSTFTLRLPIRWQGIAPMGKALQALPERILPVRKTILVVDDHPETAERIARNLQADGYWTIIAQSGKAAVELAGKHRPFAITLDIIMPEMDGWEVLQQLKQAPETREIPVIVVSVSEDRETGFALGAVGYVTKPVDKDVLIAEINRICGAPACTVMIIDDNDADRRQMARIAEQEGMRAVTAENGKIGLEMIRQSVPDLLILDLVMPEMDGMSMLSQLRKDPSLRHLPVIVVTAKDLTKEEKERLSGEAVAVIQKGRLSWEILIQYIRRVLSDIGAHQENAQLGVDHAKKRILLVDDNDAAIIQVKSVLEGDGYRVDIARGGRDAIDYVANIIPDGIILDLMMPGIDGFAVLEEVRGTTATAKIPVLILTAKDLTSEDMDKLSANHIQQLIQKGDIDRESLLEKVRAMLGIQPMMPETAVTVTRQLQETMPSADAVQSDRPTLLLIDDNADNRTTFKAIFAEHYRIIETADGVRGLDAARVERPDLIVLDLALPKMDGLTVVKSIKADPAIRHIPVVAVTSKAMKKDREEALAAGCDDYLSKPVDPEHLRRIVRHRLNR